MNAEAVCAHSWCRKPKSDQQHLSVEDLPNPYQSHHPFKPRAKLEAAFGVWQTEARADILADAVLLWDVFEAGWTAHQNIEEGVEA